MRRRTAWLLVVGVVTALAYVLLARISLTIAHDSTLTSPIWPAAGVAFGVVYQYGWRMLPSIWLGSLIANWTSTQLSAVATGRQFLIAALIAAGAAGQAALGSWLVHRKVGRHASFVTARQILLFLALSGPVACVANATVGALVQWLFGVIAVKDVAQIWLTWWTGDSNGVVVFGVLTLMLLPEQRQIWQSRRIKVGVPALATTLLSMFLFMEGGQMAQAQRQSELANTADNALHVLSERSARLTEVLEGMRGLFRASPYVSANDFQRFVNSMLQGSSGAQAVSWDPIVPHQDLHAFVEHQRVVEKLAGFTVTQKTAAGEFVPVADRPFHVVVAYIEPIGANIRALGYDIASEAVRARAIESALRTGRATATAPIALAQETGDQFGILALLAVDPAAVLQPWSPNNQRQAFVVGSYRFGDLLSSSFPYRAWPHVSFRLSDITERSSATVTASISRVPVTADVATDRRTLRIMGRVWALDVSRDMSASPVPLPIDSPGVLLIGSFIAILLISFLLLMSGLEHEARKEADLDPLTGLQNRRALLSALERARRQAQQFSTEHVLLFMDLDAFKPVNDTCGHAVGDAMLLDVADVMRRAVRERDVVARVGGDEFAVILFNCTLERGRSIAEEIVAGIAALAIPSADHLRLGVSIGMSIIAPPDPLDAEVLMHRADRASYVAKFAGGGRVVLGDASARSVRP